MIAALLLLRGPPCLRCLCSSGVPLWYLHLHSYGLCPEAGSGVGVSCLPPSTGYSPELGGGLHATSGVCSACNAKQ